MYELGNALYQQLQYLMPTLIQNSQHTIFYRAKKRVSAIPEVDRGAPNCQDYFAKLYKLKEFFD